MKPHSMNIDQVLRTPFPTEEQLLRDSFEQSGRDFEFVVIPETALGYYIEPWTNECLTGAELTPDQPQPVSLDRSDEEITEDEASIRGWINETAHPIVVRDVSQRAPTGWALLAHGYFDDWSEIEFGASVMLFTVGADNNRPSIASHDHD